MNAKKCDRCGEFYAQYRGESYNGYEVNAVYLQSDFWGVLRAADKIDLCPQCMEKQIRFLRCEK